MESQWFNRLFDLITADPSFDLIDVTSLPSGADEDFTDLFFLNLPLARPLAPCRENLKSVSATPDFGLFAQPDVGMLAVTELLL